MRSPEPTPFPIDQNRRADVDRLSVGLRGLLPGSAQLAMGQRGRALAHAGSFVSALVVAGFCWGSWLGWLALGLAAAWQLASMVDLLGQLAFPAFSTRRASLAALTALGLVVYLPLLGLLWLCAWPSQSDRISGAGYLVNRLAYRDHAPAAGQWIWIRTTPSRMPSTGQILAIENEEVECTGRGWRVNGREVRLPFPGPATDYPDGWRFRVPADHVLVGSESRGAKVELSSPLMIVARDQIIGRAWARYYPLWDRCLL